MTTLNRNSGATLVTGSTGFIGRRMVALLRSYEVPVRALVLPGESVPNWGPGVECVFGDISKLDDVRRAMAGVEDVVHLAAMVGDAGNDAMHQRVTVVGTENVLRIAEDRCRVLVVSSIVFYGDRLGRETCHEALSPGRPVGPYSRAKQAQEHVAKCHMRQGGRVVIVRPANVYGARSGPWGYDAARLLKQGMPALIDGGHGNAGLVHVDNVVSFLNQVRTTPSVDGRIFNICDSEDVTWAQYFSDVARAVGARRPRSMPGSVAECLATACEAVWRIGRFKSRPWITHEALNLVGADHRIAMIRAHEDLGYRPRISYREGMDSMGAWLRSLSHESS